MSINRKTEGARYGTSYYMPCPFTDNCGGVLLWEDATADGKISPGTAAVLYCSECDELLDGDSVMHILSAAKDEADARTAQGK